MQKYIISVDWFQVSCTRDSEQVLQEGWHIQGVSPIAGKRENVYVLQMAREFNSIFDIAFTVALHDFPIATIYAKPRPSQMPKEACSVKVMNPLLYSGRWAWYLKDICDALGWKIHNIGRVDLACDFNFFADSLPVETFIERYVSKGKGSEGDPRYYRIGSNRFAYIANKVHNSVEGSVAVRGEYLRFGSRSSGVCTYLYNKSKELQDKGGKEYIRDLWKECGLIEDDEHDVWRLEFSINSSATRVKRKLSETEREEQAQNRPIIRATETALQIRKLALDDFLTQSQVEALFWAYANKYFRFKVIGPQQFPHNWPDLTLFEQNIAPVMKPYNVHGSLNSGIAERNAARCIERLLQEERPIPLDEKISLADSIETLERYAHLKGERVTTENLITAVDDLESGLDFESIENSGHLPKNHTKIVKGFLLQALEREYDNILNAPHLADLDEEEAFYESVERDNATNYFNYIDNVRSESISLG